MFLKKTLAVVACFSLLAHLSDAPRLGAEETAEVSGQITLDGKPLAGGRILFHQESGQFVGTKIDKDLGKFKLGRIPVGRYKVTIESKGVPDKYASDEQSGLIVEMKSGTSDFNFDLTSK